MSSAKQKYAFLTMDVESFYDTSCVLASGLPRRSEFSCVRGIEVFTDMAERAGAKAVFFVTADSLDETEPYLKRAVQGGHSIGLHALTHVSPLTLTPERFAQDTDRAVQIIEERLGVRPMGYRAPCFGVDEARLAVIRQRFCYDSSNLGYKAALDSGAFDLSGFERLSSVVYRDGGFYEFKPCVGGLPGISFPVSGGAYLRMMPWWMAKWAVKRYITRHDSYILYVHPFELVDGPLPADGRLKWYYRLYLTRGRRNYAKRLEKIIAMLKKEGYTFILPEEFIALRQKYNRDL